MLLAACVAAGALSVRSRGRSDVIGVYTSGGHLQAVASHRGGFVGFVSEVPFGYEKAWDGDRLAAPAVEFDAIYDTVFHPTAVRRSLGGFVLASGTFSLGGSAPGYHAVRVPGWAVVAPVGLLTLLLAAGPLRRRRWARSGRCRQCGYDLRASPEQCPECGLKAGDPAGAGGESPERSGGRRRAVVTAALVGVTCAAAVAVGYRLLLATAARAASRVDPAEPIVRSHPVMDLTDVPYYPADRPAVWTHESADEEFGRGNRFTASSEPREFPHTYDERPERLAELLWLAEAVPAAAGANVLERFVIGEHTFVAAPREVQVQYAVLLQAMRAPAPTAGVPTVAPGERAPRSREEQDAEAKLELVLPEVWFDDVTLESAFEQLRDASRANLIVDWANLETAGVDKTARVKLRLWDVPLARALDVLLAVASPPDVDPPLGYRVEGGLVRIANRVTLDRSTELRIYDVRQLILNHSASVEEIRRRLRAQRAGMRPPTTAPRYDDAEGYTREETVEEIATFLRETVDPDNWRDNGGTIGQVREWAGRLIIGQTAENHRKIEEALKLLYDASQPMDPAPHPPPATAPAPGPPRVRGEGLFGG